MSADTYWLAGLIFGFRAADNGDFLMGAFSVVFFILSFVTIVWRK